MRLEAVELLDLHAELKGLAWSEAVAVGDAGRRDLTVARGTPMSGMRRRR